MKVKSYLVFLLILGVSLTSCYEREEGCLDTYSTNFDINADDSCDDCCTYPEVKFSISHKLGENKFSRDSITVNNNGDSIKINKAIVILGDVKLYTIDGTILEVEETSLYRDEEGNETQQKEDYVVIIDNSALVTIGEIRELGTIDSIGFHVGVAHEGVSLEESSKLFDYDSLYVNNEYYDVVLNISTGEYLAKDIIVEYKIESGTDDLGFDIVDYVKELREDVGLQLTIDYERLLKILTPDLDANKQIINLPYPDGFLTVTK